MIMKEYEQLKEICDKIWYNIDIYLSYDKLWINPFFSIREIIFTPDFMRKLSWYLWAISTEEYKELWWNIVNNLDNLVQYLYNLLWLWKH